MFIRISYVFVYQEEGVTYEDDVEEEGVTHEDGAQEKGLVGVYKYKHKPRRP